MIKQIKNNLKYWLVVLVLLLADFLASFISLILSFSNNEIVFNLRLTFLINFFILTLIFYANGRYKADPTISRFKEIQSIFRITLSYTIVLIIFNEIFPKIFFIESSMLLTIWFYLVVGLTLNRLLIRRIQKTLLAKGFGKKNTLVIGSGEKAINIAKHLLSFSNSHNLLGFINSSEKDSFELSKIKLPKLGNVNNLSEIIEEYNANEIVIALEKTNHSLLLDILTKANGSSISLRIIPDMYEVISGLAKTEELYGLPLVDINTEILSVQQKFAKRIIDIIFSFIILLGFSPVWILVSLIIKIESKGPILYRQKRVGQNGKIFIINKFRSMKDEAENTTGPVWAIEEDPRITKVGKILRKYRIDEIPQFINVLFGDMSVVGPRPERPFFIKKLIKEFPFYYRRHKIRPGITGWAQIKQSYDSSLSDVKEKLKYDFFYIENMSLSLDLQIMIRTFIVMISAKGH